MIVKTFRLVILASVVLIVLFIVNSFSYVDYIVHLISDRIKISFTICEYSYVTDRLGFCETKRFSVFLKSFKVFFD